MLDSLRRWASGWVASILIGLLVLSFAIWGVADMFTNFGGRWLAKVGTQEISSDDFQRAFREEMDGLSQRAGRRISAAQARAVGLDRQVLDRLTAMSAIESHAADLGLGLSDEALIDGLKDEPMFQGLDGKFSRDKLTAMLRDFGLSEAGLVALRRRDKLRGEVLKALESGSVVPKPLVGLVHGWREETRKVAFATIDPAKVLKPKEPTGEELKASYDENKLRYMSEPTRDFNVLLLVVDALKKTVKVPDEDVKTAYESTRESYDKPEKRRVQQLAFPDVATAQAAKKEIDGGMKFPDAVKKAGAKKTDVDLGEVTRSSLIDDKIAEAVFSLKLGEVSDVIEGQFATVLVLVTEITKGKKSTFDGVKGDVRAKLAAEMALVKIQSVFTEIDDALAAGRTLLQISADLDIPAFELTTVDRNNKTADGTTALSVKDAAPIVSAAFSGDVGVEQDPVTLSDGGFAWVEVMASAPAKQKTYDDVKDELKTTWIEDERRKALSKKAAEFVERLRGGEKLEVIAKEVGGKVEMSDAVTRAKIPKGLNEAVMTQVFVLPNDGASSAETIDGKSRVLFRVTEVTDAGKPTDEQTRALDGELSGAMQREQSEQYIQALSARYNTQVNNELFKRLTGADTQ